MFERLREYGYIRMFVYDSERTKPNFHYSAGIFETLRKSEILIFGTDQDTGSTLISHYVNRLRAGESFAPGVSYQGFFEVADATFVPVASKDTSLDITTWTSWFYDRKGFPLLQLVWPDPATGKFPWEPGCGERTIARQPIYGKPVLLH